jgi:hypothetical protein
LPVLGFLPPPFGFDFFMINKLYRHRHYIGLAQNIDRTHTLTVTNALIILIVASRLIYSRAAHSSAAMNAAIDWRSRQILSRQIAMVVWWHFPKLQSLQRIPIAP